MQCSCSSTENGPEDLAEISAGQGKRLEERSRKKRPPRGTSQLPPMLGDLSVAVIRKHRESVENFLRGASC